MKTNKVTLLWLIVIICGWLPRADGQTNEWYFYSGKNYGSEANIHPISLILHGGFGILQLDNRSNAVRDIDFRTGWNNLVDNLRHPIRAIDDFGWQDFLFSEIVPFSFNRNSAQYWPNYTMHLIGGGMSYRMMVEWFQYHGFNHPRWFALTTIATYHLLNEVVENDRFRGTNVDPIADVYLFDPLGILLFSFDSVARFFSHTLHLRDWSYQFSFDPRTGSIQNNGQNFVMKFDLGRKSRWSLFYYYGNHGELGLSYKLKRGRSLSFGLGLTAKNLINNPEKSSYTLRSLTTDLVLAGGLFYDQDNSLLASLIFASRKNDMLRLNLYPGLLAISHGISPGLFVVLNRQGRVYAGLQLSFLPFGVGFGW